MKKKYLYIMAASLLVAGVEAKDSIYKEGWIDFNKNGRKDIYEDPAQPVEKRVEDLKASFDGYLPDQLTQLEENAQVLENGNCICLVTGQAEGAAAAAKIFTDAQ